MLGETRRPNNFGRFLLALSLTTAGYTLWGLCATKEDVEAGLRGVNASLSSYASPDFGNYIHVKTLEWEHFDNDDRVKRIMIVGDIHGMGHSLRRLLSMLSYNPSNDLLITTGDVLTRGSTPSASLDVLSFLTANNITGVRGNHDQTIVEWRAWIEWVLSHEGGEAWLTEVERRAAAKADETDVLRVSERRNHPRDFFDVKSEGEGWKRIPEGWEMMDEHYVIARNMTSASSSYLLSLPLSLHIPQLHTFIVHGGILPLDPKQKITAETQPLAHAPEIDLSEGDKEEENETVIMRRAQERALFEDISQNADPWVLLNVRGVTDDNEVTRSNNETFSTPWSVVWNSIISLCNGFNSEDKVNTGLLHQPAPNPRNPPSDQLHLSLANSEIEVSGELSLSSEKVEVPGLRCHPSTVVYGHAATRGLDLKRWTKGLDSGCSYGRRLSALVLSMKGASFSLNSRSLHPDDPENDKEVVIQPTDFGEDDLSVEARAVSVACKLDVPFA